MASPRIVHLNGGLAARLALGFVAAFTATRFAWTPACTWLTEAVATIGGGLGLPLARTGPRLLELGAMQVDFTLECTLLHGACAMVPILWDRRRGARWNAGMVAALFAGTFAWATIRVLISLLGVHAGLPWWLAHEVLCGVTDFAFFLVAARRQPWAPRAEESVSPPEAAAAAPA